MKDQAAASAALEAGTGQGVVTPLRILIYALGGEGGGVLMNWIVAAARSAGHQVQATSVPGVAQRTGSTSYYIEIAPPGSRAVLGLMPMPGRVDVVLASELAEAARALEAGFVAPGLTTLIASINRVYATAEKISMGDGRFDDAKILEAAEKLAHVAHLHDLDKTARDAGTFISATLYGALAGSGVLPWSQAESAAVIGSGARAEASLAGFEAAAALVSGTGSPQEAAPAAPAPAAPALLPEAVLQGAAAPLREAAALGHERVTDFQDSDYGALYLQRVARICAAGTPGDHRSEAAMAEAFRRLALWMAYEDVARVADLKTRPERFARIAEEAQLAPGQLLKVTDFLKPRAEEVADVLPARLGGWVMAQTEKGRSLPFLGRGVRLRSNGVLGYWLLRATAQMRRIRRRSLRYQKENAAIEAWLDALCAALPEDPGFAEALAALPRLRKGYSDTLARGLRAYGMVWDEVVEPAAREGYGQGHTARLRGAVSAALADDTHGKLKSFLAGESGAGAQPVPVLRSPGQADGQGAGAAAPGAKG